MAELQECMGETLGSSGPVIPGEGSTEEEPTWGSVVKELEPMFCMAVELAWLQEDNSWQESVRASMSQRMDKRGIACAKPGESSHPPAPWWLNKKHPPQLRCHQWEYQGERRRRPLKEQESNQH